MKEWPQQLAGLVRRTSRVQSQKLCLLGWFWGGEKPETAASLLTALSWGSWPDAQQPCSGCLTPL